MAIIVLAATSAVLLAGLGGQSRPSLRITPVHRLTACASSDCGAYAVTMQWGVFPPWGHTTTGYNVLCTVGGSACNGTPYGTTTDTSFVVTGMDCGKTFTLGVQAHDSTTPTQNTSYTVSSPYTTPACATSSATQVGAPTPSSITCTGSPLNPGANVQTAVASAAAGSTVCLNSGSWSAISLSGISPSSNVTLAATPGQTVTVPGFTLSGDNNLTVEGFFVESAANNGFNIFNAITGGLTLTHNTIENTGVVYGTLSSSIQPSDGIRTNLPTNSLSHAISGSVFVINATDHQMQSFPATSASVGATSVPLNSTTCNPTPPTVSPCIPTDTFPAGSLVLNGGIGIEALAGSSNSNVQNGVTITYNLIDNAATFIEVQGDVCGCASADTNWTISHNVMGPGMGWGGVGHYIEGQWIGATVNNNAFIGPQWFSPIAHSNVFHCDTFHQPGCQNVTFDNNIIWHAQSRAQTILVTDNNLSNMVFQNNLLVDDPQCNSLLGGSIDCPASPWFFDKASGLTLTNNTSANAAWSVNMSQTGGTESIPTPSNYDIENNIATGPALSGQNSYGSYGCVTAPCVAQNNVSQDNSATAEFGAGNVNNWTPTWQDTTWTWASSGATSPWTPPANDYYKPVTGSGVVSTMGWQGGFCSSTVTTNCIGP